jgi:NADH-quinone oxidoreductase subunit L
MSKYIVPMLLTGVVVAPLMLFAALALTLLFGRPLSETATSRLTRLTLWIGLLCTAGIVGVMWQRSTWELTLTIGDWISIPHYDFTVELMFDRLSIPFVMLSFILLGVVCVFAERYMHREQGFHRFYLLYAMFLSGMVIASLAGTMETLFAGWELVGLSSALLVAFFHDRPAPVRNGLGVWTFYRVSDAALLFAAVLLHHWSGTGEFRALTGGVPWPEGHSVMTAGRATVVGGLLLAAAAGKSALIPFSGWLPRAMEGPTPSSAIVYGALSVHLGAFLLLRSAAIIEQSVWLEAGIVLLGLSTAVFASLAGRAQTDIKTSLAFASLTQIGLIVAEIGCGLRMIALAHMVGHVCVRTLQFLRAPSLLRDLRSMENALGSHLPHVNAGIWGRLSEQTQTRMYRFALERGYLDAALRDYLARPVLTFFRACDRLERRWTGWLSRAGQVESGRRGAEPAEELL